MTRINPDSLSTDRIPPQDLQAERAVLGSALVDLVALDTMLEMLVDTDFYATSNAQIYKAMRELRGKGGAIDVVALDGVLKKKGQDLTVYLADLLDNVATSANIAYHCKTVKDKRQLRDLISGAHEIINAAFESDSAEESVYKAESIIYNVVRNDHKGEFVRLRDSLPGVVEDIHCKKIGVVSGIPTGFHNKDLSNPNKMMLDEITGGLQREDMIILAGRPSNGKTALSLTMVLSMAKHNWPVAIFTLESSRAQLNQRLVSLESRVDLHQMRMGWMNKPQHDAVEEAKERIRELPIYIDDTYHATMDSIRSKVRRMVHGEDVELVVIDYAQLIDRMSLGRGLSVNDAYEIISRGLKTTAKEMHIPFLVLSQLSRAKSSGKSKEYRPYLDDLRGSGAWEQDADVVLFIHREELYAKGDEERDLVKGDAEIIIAKQRNGPIGKVDIKFDKTCARFYDPLDAAEQAF